MLVIAEVLTAGERHMINNAVADEWDHSSGDIDLSADEVLIWRASLNQDAEAIARSPGTGRRDRGRKQSKRWQNGEPAS
jgi:hypothetical protein